MIKPQDFYLYFLAYYTTVLDYIISFQHITQVLSSLYHYFLDYIIPFQHITQVLSSLYHYFLDYIIPF
jgi:hypothetical protein